MSVDTSKTDSNFKVEKIQSKDEPSLNERLFACQEYKTEIFVYLRSLQVIMFFFISRLAGQVINS